MASRIRVFVGPSWPQAADQSLPGIEFCAPAVRGDLLKAHEEGVEAIGLIDGEFNQSLAVTPTEVRQVGQAGVRLFGAASIGALRAVECPDVMTGIGRVHQWFAEGTIDSDDEVAGTYFPGTYETCAVPLVNIRYGLKVFPRRAELSEAFAANALEAVQRLPYDSRDSEQLLDVWRSLPGSPTWLPELVEFVFSEEASIKLKDSQQLVTCLTQLANEERPE